MKFFQGYKFSHIYLVALFPFFRNKKKKGILTKKEHDYASAEENELIATNEYEYIDIDDMIGETSKTHAGQDNTTTIKPEAEKAHSTLKDEYIKTETDVLGGTDMIDNELYESNTNSDGIMVENCVYEKTK